MARDLHGNVQDRVVDELLLSYICVAINPMEVHIETYSKTLCVCGGGGGGGGGGDNGPARMSNSKHRT